MNPVTDTFLVPEELHGSRLDQAAAALLPQYSRSRLSQWIKDQHILLNNKPANPKDKVSQGDRIAIDVNVDEPVIDFSQCPPQQIDLDIIYEDDQLIIINKPADLVVHPGAGNKDMTLVNGLLYYDESLKAVPRAGIIHRLDKDTTGLLMVARTPEAHNELVKQLQAREVKRTYLALVHGDVISGDTIDTYFGRCPRHRLKMAVKEHGKQAITQYKVIERFGYLSLLEVSLLTGRTHQIRVHMSHIHHPILGDSLYGGKRFVSSQLSEEIRNQCNQFPRQALHAYKLAFNHPQNKKWIEFEAPPPNDFQELIDGLKNNKQNLSS